MTRIAVIGAGAIGGTLAAWLAQTHEVLVCARSPLVDLEVVTPTRTIRAKPRVVLEPAAATPVAWVLATTKTYDSAAAPRGCPRSLGRRRGSPSSRMGSSIGTAFPPWRAIAWCP